MKKILVYIVVLGMCIPFYSQEKPDLSFEFITVPAGEFTWGQNDDTLTIAYDYQIMKYEVTNAEYLGYLQKALKQNKITISGDNKVEGMYEGDSRVEAGNYMYLDMSSSDGHIHYVDGQFVIDAGYESHPVVEVTWFGANAFARFYNCRLPTEQEWEKSARGKTGFDFPWGNKSNSRRANYFDSGDPFDNGTTPIGFFNGKTYNGFQTINSPSVYGAYDLAGNVWEWTHSFYSKSTQHRVIRGGSWGYSTYCLPSWVRFNGYPFFGSQVGFRLAKVK